MREVGREETLGILQASLKRLTEGRRALEAGEFLAAMRALAESKELNARAISAALTACLRDALNLAEKADIEERERQLDNLVHLAGFALSDLCLPCRQKVGSRLKRDQHERKSERSRVL